MVLRFSKPVNVIIYADDTVLLSPDILTFTAILESTFEELRQLQLQNFSHETNDCGLIGRFCNPDLCSVFQCSRKAALGTAYSEIKNSLQNIANLNIQP